MPKHLQVGTTANGNLNLNTGDLTVGNGDVTVTSGTLEVVNGNVYAGESYLQPTEVGSEDGWFYGVLSANGLVINNSSPCMLLNDTIVLGSSKNATRKTADTSGVQTTATDLVAHFTRVISTVASSSVKLVDISAGYHYPGYFQWVKCVGPESSAVYPSSGQAINGYINTPIVIPSGQSKMFVAMGSADGYHNWETF